MLTTLARNFKRPWLFQLFGTTLILFSVGVEVFIKSDAQDLTRKQDLLEIQISILQSSGGVGEENDHEMERISSALEQSKRLTAEKANEVNFVGFLSFALGSVLTMLGFAIEKLKEEV